MAAELLSAALREQLLIDFDEFHFGELARGTVNNEALVPDLDLLFAKLRVIGQKEHVRFGDLVVGASAAHRELSDTGLCMGSQTVCSSIGHFEICRILIKTPDLVIRISKNDE